MKGRKYVARNRFDVRVWKPRVCRFYPFQCGWRCPGYRQMSLRPAHWEKPEDDGAKYGLFRVGQAGRTSQDGMPFKKDALTIK